MSASAPSIQAPHPAGPPDPAGPAGPAGTCPGPLRLPKGASSPSPCGSAEVERWLLDVKSDPRRHLARAEACLQAIGPSADRVAARLHRLAAAAALELDLAALASDHARLAVRMARRGDERPEEGLARTLLARILAYRGSPTAAAREADRAEPLLAGAALGALAVQRVVILWKLGDPQRALAQCDLALRLLGRDPSVERAKALNNRGVLQLYLGDLRRGVADLGEAEAQYRQLGLVVGAADARLNRGMLLDRLGDLPAALAAFDAAERELAALGVPTALYALARADTLMAAGLVDEAIPQIRAAVEQLAASGMDADAAEGRLRLARAQLAQDPGAAATIAQEAAQVFAARRQRGWALLAAHVEVVARFRAGARDAALLRAARRLAPRLEAAGMHQYQVETWTILGSLCAARGHDAEAAAAFERAAASRDGGSVAQRTRAWEARARGHLLGGRRHAARRAVNAGLRLLDEHRAALPASDLRAHAGGIGRDLALLGLELAVAGGRPADVWQWSERGRAGTFRLPRVLPPDDERLGTLLSELRRRQAEWADAELAGRPTEDASRRVVELESEIRRVARCPTAVGGATAGHRAASASASAASAAAAAMTVAGSVARTPSVAELRATLDGRLLLELVEHRDRLGAVLLGPRRTTLRWSSVPLPDAAAAARRAAFVLGRLARLPAGRARDLAFGQLDAALAPLARVLDELLGPSARHAGADVPLVVVPSPALHDVPWALLLGAPHGRPITVAPSAALWRDASGRRAASPRTVLVAGPGLRGADEEVEELAALHPCAQVLRGEAASCAAVGAAMEGAAMAHIAAHGRIRRDNPLFSAIELADGAATVYDLERVARAPAVVVLASCNSTLAQVVGGGELLGLAAALLGQETAAVIASSAPLADDAAVGLMADLHRGLAAARPASEALAAAQALRWRERGPDFLAAASVTHLGGDPVAARRPDAARRPGTALRPVSPIVAPAVSPGRTRQ